MKERFPRSEGDGALNHKSACALPVASPSPERAKDWLIWQLADSAFPTGGFGHSGGLEAAWQQGEVRNSGELMEFLEVSLFQLRRSTLPFVKAAHQQEGDFARLDLNCDAFLGNHVANRASRAQGQSFLSSAARSFALPALHEFRDRVLCENLPGHSAPVFGAVGFELGLDLATTVRLHVFIQMRSILSSAVRLGVVGPLEAQSLQQRLSPIVEVVSATPHLLDLEQASQAAPLLDLWQGMQDRLYSRLFQS